jgi:hypothetical protein
MNAKHLLIALFVFARMAPAYADFRVGIAVRVVTPDPLLPVSGGVGASHAVSEKNGELNVRAMVLDDGVTKVAFVSADFLGFPAVLGDTVREAVKAIPAQNILIAATHTHSAPDCYGFPDGKGGTSSDPKYLNMVCGRMAEAISDAAEHTRPAKLKIATGEAKGQIAYNYYAEQLYDPRCHVIQAIGEDGNPFATLVNYAVHPEVIGNRRGICSPDLVGPLYDRIAEKMGGTCIFINSAQGGMVTADNRRAGGGQANDWAECQRIGGLLADEALRIVGDTPEQSVPKLFCAAKPLTFPVDSPLMRQLLAVLPRGKRAVPNDYTVTTQLNLVNVGNAQIITIPGEALPNIGYYLKRKMRGEHNLLFGLTNDAFGYILTKEDFASFKRYDYISRTSLGERTGEILVNDAIQFVSECPAPERLSRN